MKMKKVICLLGMLVLMLLPLLAAAEEAGMPVLNPFPDEEAVPVKTQLAEGPLPLFPICKKTPEGYKITRMSAWGVDPEDCVTWTFSSATGEWTADDSEHYEDTVKIVTGSLPPDAAGLGIPLRSVNPAYDSIHIVFDLYPAGVYSVTLVKGEQSVECMKSSGWFSYEWADGSVARYDKDGNLQIFMYRKETGRLYRVDRVEDPETGEVTYQVADLNDGKVDPEKLPFRLVDGEETVPLTVP